MHLTAPARTLCRLIPVKNIEANNTDDEICIQAQGAQASGSGTTRLENGIGMDHD